MSPTFDVSLLLLQDDEDVKYHDSDAEPRLSISVEYCEEKESDAPHAHAASIELVEVKHDDNRRANNARASLAPIEPSRSSSRSRCGARGTVGTLEDSHDDDEKNYLVVKRSRSPRRSPRASPAAPPLYEKISQRKKNGRGGGGLLDAPLPPGAHERAGRSRSTGQSSSRPRQLAPSSHQRERRLSPVSEHGREYAVSFPAAPKSALMRARATREALSNLCTPFERPHRAAAATASPSQGTAAAEVRPKSSAVAPTPAPVRVRDESSSMSTYSNPEESQPPSRPRKLKSTGAHTPRDTTHHEVFEKLDEALKSLNRLRMLRLSAAATRRLADIPSLTHEHVSDASTRYYSKLNDRFRGDLFGCVDELEHSMDYMHAALGCRSVVAASDCGSAAAASDCRSVGAASDCRSAVAAASDCRSAVAAAASDCGSAASERVESNMHDELELDAEDTMFEDIMGNLKLAESKNLSQS